MVRSRSYIVRVYARRPRNRVDGIVEVVASGVRHSFATAEDLWAIVRPGRSPRGARRPSPPRREIADPTDTDRS